MDQIKHLSERQRRSYYRRTEKGDHEGAQKILDRAEQELDEDEDWGEESDNEEESER